MPTFFVDSSALLKRYRNEAGSQWVSDLLRGPERPLISRLSVVEVSSALVRRAGASAMSPESVRSAIRMLDDDVRDSFDLIELDELVMDHAVAVTRVHALRGADAIQLACLVLAQRRSVQIQLRLLSADDELNVAAAAEGFQIENPNLHP